MRLLRFLILLLPFGLHSQITYTYTYDENGRLVGVETGDGQAIQFTLDNRGNLVEITTAGLPPGTESLWEGPLGDKLTGIGWINDEDYPYVWLYPIGSFVWIADAFSSKDSFWGYDLKDAFWFWSSDGYGGWYLHATDPTHGVGGWAKWGE